MVKKISWAIIVLFALLIGTMPFIILFKGIQFGIEDTKETVQLL